MPSKIDRSIKVRLSSFIRSRLATLQDHYRPRRFVLTGTRVHCAHLDKILRNTGPKQCPCRLRQLRRYRNAIFSLSPGGVTGRRHITTTFAISPENQRVEVTVAVKGRDFASQPIANAATCVGRQPMRLRPPGGTGWRAQQWRGRAHVSLHQACRRRHRFAAASA